MQKRSTLSITGVLIQFQSLVLRHGLLLSCCMMASMHLRVLPPMHDGKYIPSTDRWHSRHLLSFMLGTLSGRVKKHTLCITEWTMLPSWNLTLEWSILFADKWVLCFRWCGCSGGAGRGCSCDGWHHRAAHSRHVYWTDYRSAPNPSTS